MPYTYSHTVIQSLPMAGVSSSTNVFGLLLRKWQSINLMRNNPTIVTFIPNV